MTARKTNEVLQQAREYLKLVLYVRIKQSKFLGHISRCEVFGHEWRDKFIKILAVFFMLDEF